ncbi:unnamed protein product [Natator depressus]
MGTPIDASWDLTPLTPTVRLSGVGSAPPQSDRERPLPPLPAPEINGANGALATHSGMAGKGSSRMVSLERRNQALMEKIKSLQVANANLRYMNLRLKEENEVFKSTEEILLRDNDKIKQKIIQLTELQESLQDDIYILEEQLWLARPASISVNIMGTFKERGTVGWGACTCHEGKREENIEPFHT